MNKSKTIIAQFFTIIWESVVFLFAVTMASDHFLHGVFIFSIFPISHLHLRSGYAIIKMNSLFEI